MRWNCWLYARISEDPRDQRRGIKKQVEDLRVHAVDQDWDVRGEFTDNDLSAHNGEERPDYERLMAAIKVEMPAILAAGDRGVLLGWHTSRVWRNRVERAQAIEDLRKVGCYVAFEQGGFFNLAKATERSQLAQLGESDTLESDVKAERVAREALARAREGRANGAVLFGWRRVYRYDDRGHIDGFDDVEHEEQATIVKEVIERLDRAESLYAIRDDLNRRGVLPPGAHLQFKKKSRAADNLDGTKWSKSSVKKLAMRPGNAGFRIHHGELYKGAFPALVDEAKWRRVVDRLTAPERSVTRDAQRKHLLSWGIGQCGVCGGLLRVAKRGNRKRGQLLNLYVCDATRSCVGRSEAYVDAWVGQVVIARLSRPDARRVFAGDHELADAEQTKADALRGRLNAAADDYAQGILTREQLARITGKLRGQIERHEEEAKRLRPKDSGLLKDLLDAETEAEAAESWEGLDVVQQRTVLDILGIRVRILPVLRRGPGFDPDTVEIVWPHAD